MRYIELSSYMERKNGVFWAITYHVGDFRNDCDDIVNKT